MVLEIRKGVVSCFYCSPVGSIRKLDYAVGTGPHRLAVFVGNYHRSGITGITWVCVVGTVFHPLNLSFPFSGAASLGTDGYMSQSQLEALVRWGLSLRASEPQLTDAAVGFSAVPRILPFLRPDCSLFFSFFFSSPPPFLLLLSWCSPAHRHIQSATSSPACYCYRRWSRSLRPVCVVGRDLQEQALPRERCRPDLPP